MSGFFLELALVLPFAIAVFGMLWILANFVKQTRRGKPAGTLDSRVRVELDRGSARRLG